MNFTFFRLSYALGLHFITLANYERKAANEIMLLWLELKSNSIRKTLTIWKLLFSDLCLPRFEVQKYAVKDRT